LIIKTTIKIIIIITITFINCIIFNFTVRNYTLFLLYYYCDCEIIDNWYDRFEEVKHFIKKNKEKPSEKSQNKTEKSLGCWLGHQKKNYKNKKEGMKDEVKYNLWTQFLEEYKEYIKDIGEKWNENLEKVEDFIKKNKKRPSDHSHNKTEKQLGQWIADQKKYYKKKTSGMKDETRYKLWTQFLEEYKEYFNDIVEIWNKNLEKVEDFIKKNKKRPSSKSHTKIEKFLGNWLAHQQNNYKKITSGMKDENKYKLWTQFLEDYKEYFKDIGEKWNENFEKAKDFTKKNKKRPSSNSHTESEKLLGRWFDHQQSNYKKKKEGMKDEIKYKLWTQFLEDYKEYLTNNICEEEIPVIITPKKKSMKLNNSSAKKKETPEQKRQRIQSEISQLHKKYKTMKSENLSKEFNENPDLWNTYHQISEENEKSFPEDEIPRNRIIQELNKIKTKRSKKIVDMGCGKAQISKYFQNDKRFEFINYDHISSEETVIPCDISKLPLEDDSVEICILSLAMWGSNCRDYIKESHRVLESNGRLYIIEPTKRWSEQDDQGNILPEKEACKMKSLLEENSFQIVEKNIEKFCLFVCNKV
jgi:ribosomal RNA-processing protein 8